MLVKIPYVYEVRGRYGKSARTVHQVGYVEREVEDRSSSEAPLVAEWEDRQGFSMRHVGCRHMDGAHYLAFPEPLTPDMVGLDGTRPPGYSIQALFHNVFHGREGSYAENIFQCVMMGIVPNVGNFQKPLDSVVTSEEDIRRMQATSFLNSLVFIDGQAWIRNHEPKINVSCQPNGRNPIITIDTVYDNNMERPGFGPHSRSKWLDTDVFLNLSDEEAARGLLMDRVGPHNPAAAQSVIGAFNSLVIHDPGAFSFDGHPARMAAIGRHVVRLLRPKIGYSHSAIIREWLELSEKATRASDYDAELIEALLVALIPEVEDPEEKAMVNKDLVIARITRELLDRSTRDTRLPHSAGPK